MHIVDFSPYYPPHIGGVERCAIELHENLVKNGFTVTVFTPRLPTDAHEQELRDGITIVRYPAVEIIPAYPIPRFWTKTFWRQWQKLRSEHADVAVGTSRFFVQPLIALFFSWRKDIPLVHIEHGSDFVKGRFVMRTCAWIFDHTFGRLALRRADEIITPSRSAQAFVKKLSGRDATLIYRGVPLAEIDHIAADQQLRKKYANKKVIVYIGRLIYGKGVTHLLQAAQEIERDDVVVLIVGDGPEKEKLEREAQRRDLADTITFLGSVEFTHAISIIKIADIVVNPSYNEGLPTSLLEAGSCAKAIVATDVGGSAEIVTHNESALLIKPYDTAALTEALEKLLDDPAERTRLGDAARHAIEKNFDVQKSIAAYDKLFHSVQKS